MPIARVSNWETDRPLRGHRLGFYTSVVGMGGSEVLVADAMEAAYKAGAEVVCWSEPEAAIRRITLARTDRLSVSHRAWPRGTLLNRAGSSVGIASVQRPRSRAVATICRKLIPIAVKRWAGFRRTASAFQTELRHAPVDLLFVNVNGSEAVSVGGRSCGLPVINCYHLSFTNSTGGPLTRLGDWAARRATMKAGTLAVHISQAARDRWSGQYGYPLERTRVIYSGVDLVSSPDRATTRAALGIEAGAFVFCVPGRLDAVKGHHYLLRAIQSKKQQFVGSRVLICGDGGLRTELEHTVLRNGLEGIVLFLGWRNDLPAILHAGDCTVLASIASENLSVAVLESLMAGTPAIVTRVGGMTEAVRDGETGYVVPPRDSKALGVAMLRVLADRRTVQRMRKTAREDALARFTRARMMAEYVSVFAEALGKPQ